MSPHTCKHCLHAAMASNGFSNVGSMQLKGLHSPPCESVNCMCALEKIVTFFTTPS